MLSSLRVLLALPLVLVFAAACPLEAVPQVQAQTAAANMVTEFKGKWQGLERGMIKVLRDDGAEVYVQPPDDASLFQFVATAKPPFLHRGTFVRFRGTFNQAGVSQSPVTRVEVFQPLPRNAKVAGHVREKFLPGIYADRESRNQPPQPVAEYDVVGGLMGLDGSSGIMVVQAPNPQMPDRQIQVRARLSPDVEFEIRYNNPSLAQEGDPVSVAGFYQPPDDTKVKAERVTITTDRVYGEPSATPTRRSSRRRTRGTESTGQTASETVEQEAAETASPPASAESPLGRDPE